MIQTHASFLFIAGPFVYKVKKPVNFGFLDFSTLEKRRHYCEREITLNRRLTSGIYLGVLPISIRRGHFTFGENGHVVEYAIKMRKLSEPRFLNRLIETNEVTEENMHRIASVLKEFYEAQHPTTEIESWGRIDRLRISTDENFRQTKEFIGRTISLPTFETIRFYTDHFFRRHRRLFTRRIKERRIRDCHGDLHLDHIHITPRALNIYDCIEFNDRLRYVDVASDIAFLAMDLDHKGRPDLAREFVTRIASDLNDDGFVQLMNFYKCYRAYVRGKVESLHSVASAAPEAERETSAEYARRYFNLALQYVIAGSQPMALIVMGRIASGKSTLAHALGTELDWEVYSSDYIRKKTAGYPLYERRSAAARHHLYSADMTRQTYDHLLRSAVTKLNSGRSLILDATFARAEQRDLLIKRLGKGEFNWCVLEAHTSNIVAKKRLRDREASSNEVSDARLEDFKTLSEIYEPPEELPAERRLRVSTTASLDQTVTNALKKLARLRVDATD